MSLSIMSSSSVISLLWEGVYFSLFVMYVFLFKMRKYVNTGWLLYVQFVLQLCVGLSWELTLEGQHYFDELADGVHWQMLVSLVFS